MQPYWVDCDPVAESKRIGREMGCIAPPADYTCGDLCGIYEEKFAEKIVPREEWMDLFEELQPNQCSLAKRTLDQNGFGTCTSFAMSKAATYQWSRKYGPEWELTFAGPSMYPFCASGGNSGSSTSCIFRRATQHGMLPSDTPQNRKVLSQMGLNSTHVCHEVQWNAGKRVPQEYWEETGKHFRVNPDESYEIQSLDGFFSALWSGYTILYGRSGHAICGVDPEWSGSTWQAIYHNSWKASWGRRINGLGGYGVDTESYLRRTGAYRWAYAIRSLIEPPGADKLLPATPQVLNN